MRQDAHSTKRKTRLEALPSGALHGHFTCPGDKSISHRSLILGALAEGKTRIRGLLDAEDVARTRTILEAMGARITTETTSESADTTSPSQSEVVTVDGVGLGSLIAPAQPLDFGNSGTSCRLLMGIIAGCDLEADLTGDESLSARPMQRVIEPLQMMGAQVLPHYRSRLPFSFRGLPSPLPINYRLPVASAQVKSAILLAALTSRGTTRIFEPGLSRDHTERALTAMGANLSIGEENGVRVIEITGGQSLQAQDITVPSDISSAAFGIVAASIIPNSEVTFRGLLFNPTRDGIITSLREMGADLQIDGKTDVGGEQAVDLTVRSADLRGVHIPASRAASMIDEYPILSVAAAYASGESRFDGLHELTVKESDRLAAVENGLTANGVNCRTTSDHSLIISGTGGKIPGGAMIASNLDHRIAMSFAILGLASIEGCQIDDSSAIATSFPSFVDLFRQLGARIKLSDLN